MSEFGPDLADYGLRMFKLRTPEECDLGIEDLVDHLIRRSIQQQEEAFEQLAGSGCFVDDLWLVYHPGFPQRWSAAVGEPIWRRKYSDNA